MSIRSCILGIRLGVNRGELHRTRNWARSPTMQSAARSCAGALRHTSTHLERTQGEPREPQVFEAVIEKIEEVSPEVKSLCFRISKGDGHFRAGQWVDFLAPGLEVVGGFSMTSTPRDLPCLSLAIKFSKHPPALWCHQNARTGDVVRMRVGGRFSFSAPDDLVAADATHLLLIAGGIGITPMRSIAAEADAWLAATSREGEPPAKVSLIYSARQPADHSFRHFFDGLARRHASRVLCKYTVTRDHDGTWTGDTGRIDLPMLRSVLERQQQDAARTLCYVPPRMIDDMRSLCLEAGVPQRNVRFEKWW